MDNYSTSVTVTNMQTGKSEVHNFITLWEADKYFMEKCDELGYEYDPKRTDTFLLSSGREAGGIGHDYKIILDVDKTQA